MNPQTEIKGRGAPMRPEKSGLDCYSEGPARANARCQTEIEGRPAACWPRPPGRPKKAALDHYSGAEILACAHTRCLTIFSGNEQCADRGLHGFPRKWPWTAIRGAEIPARPRALCQTDIEERRAARWRGPWGVP